MFISYKFIIIEILGEKPFIVKKEIENNKIRFKKKDIQKLILWKNKLINIFRGNNEIYVSNTIKNKSKRKWKNKRN